MPTQPKSCSKGYVEKSRMLRQRMGTEYQPRLFTLEHAVNKGLDTRLKRWQLLREGINWKMLHAVHLIDGQTGENFLVIDNQNTPFLALRRQVAAEETAQIHNRQIDSRF